MNYRFLTISLTLLVVGLGLLFFSKTKQAPVDNTVNNEVQTERNEFKFSNPKKSAHYETNTPAHGSVLAAPPVNISLDFNFDLAAPSSISVIKDGAEYATGDLVIDTNQLTMRRAFKQDAPNGLYKVIYNACWPDRSCHDGHFEFAIDRTLAQDYQDLTGQAEVTVRMSDIKFKPQNIKVSKGTKVIWVNDEDEMHYVNSDSHPAHTYYLPQNSGLMRKGESYSVTFNTAGIYPYHCSAHAANMTGNILVQ